MSSSKLRLSSFAFPAAAFALGVTRGSGLPMTSDTAFHLVRAGNSFLRGSLDGWSLPPGGTHAPWLGAFVTAFGALFADDPEGKILVSGCALLGAAAALLARVLASLENALVAVLGIALLLLPPGLASSFNHRPDAALGGVLLLLAASHALRDEPAHRALWPAWIAALATPWAIPAALTLQVVPGLRGRRDPLAFAPVLTVVAATAALSWSLPAGAHGQFLVGLFGEVGAPGAAFGERVETIRIAWGGGLLLLPLLLSIGPRETRLPARVMLPWAASAACVFLFGTAGAFRGATAALAPTACLGLALVAARVPDPAQAGGAFRRPIVLALLLPLLAALLTTRDDRALRDRVRGDAVRDAQLGAILWADLKEPGDIAAERTGALAAISGRVAHGLRDDGSLPVPLPRYIVLAGGKLPMSDRERALFESPGFLAAYAPCELRRGRASEFADAIWVRRTPPAAQVDPDYARTLSRAWAAQASGDSAAIEYFRDAVTIEPTGLGLAREGLGIELERRHEEPAAETAFEEARARDAACVLARGHLADRALTRHQIPHADSLINEAFRFQRQLAELRGTRARLFAIAGYPAEAEKESAVAVRANPRDARLLVNHGILLWRRGATDEAREVWSRALRADPQQVRYLGKFEAAPASAPAPPLIPLFSDVGFAPVRPSADASAGKSFSAPPAASRP